MHVHMIRLAVRALALSLFACAALAQGMLGRIDALKQPGLRVK